ncbi:MAG: hypothetical protein QM731_02190 [Chitinophagaceae bacterium]
MSIAKHGFKLYKPEITAVKYTSYGTIFPLITGIDRHSFVNEVKGLVIESKRLIPAGVDIRQRAFRSWCLHQPLIGNIGLRIVIF